MHPQTAKNRSKKEIKAQLRAAKDRIAELTGEMLLLHTILGMADQLDRQADRIVVKLPIPEGWFLQRDGMEIGHSEIAIRFYKKREKKEEEQA
jgi:hypothetical protein